MDEEETILFGGPNRHNASAMPTGSLKSALLGGPTVPDSKKMESPFLNLGAPAALTTATAPPQARRKNRATYTRDELLKMRKNVLMTDLPPGFNTSFLREQQELAQAFDRGYMNSPPGKGFHGPGSYEGKRTWSTQNSMEEPLSAFIQPPTGSIAHGWRRDAGAQQDQPQGADKDTAGMVRANSWREPYKPAGPVRSALVDGLQAPEPPNLPSPGAALMGTGRGRGFGRGDDRRPRDGGGYDARGGRGLGRRPAVPAAEEGGMGFRARPSADEPRPGRWEATRADEKKGWRAGPGTRPAATTREWKDKPEDRGGRDNPRGGPGKWDTPAAGSAPEPAGGLTGMTAADFEAERLQFQAQWRKEKGGAQNPPVNTDDQQSLLHPKTTRPAVSQVDSYFGDAASPARPAVAEDGDSRFASLFNLVDEGNAPVNPQVPPAAATGQPTNGLGMILGSATAAAMPKMPSNFKTLEDLEGSMMQPPSARAAPLPSAASTQGATEVCPSGGNFLNMLQMAGGNHAAPAPTAPKKSGDWSAATAQLSTGPMPAGAPKEQNTTEKPAQEGSQLSSLLQGLGIPIQAGQSIQGSTADKAAPTTQAFSDTSEQQPRHPPPGFPMSQALPPNAMGQQPQMHGYLGGQMPPRSDWVHQPGQSGQPIPHMMPGMGPPPPGMPPMMHPGMMPPQGMPPQGFHPHMPQHMHPHHMPHPIHPSQQHQPQGQPDLGRFFNLVSMSSAGPMPAMPPMPSAAHGQHQTLEELERQLQRQ